MRLLQRLLAGAMAGAAAVAVLAAPPALPDAAAERARVNYLLYCSGCHLPDGHGAPGTVPDLREYLGEFAQHEHARSFIARVPGASGAPVSDAELTDVLNWILLTMNGDQLRAGFRPYTVEEVARYRRDPLIDVEPVRQDLIRSLATGTD